jgi:hypothetical protein
MPGWLTLVIDLEPSPEQRNRLLGWLTAGSGRVNQTTLREMGKDIGSLVALSKEALAAAKDATASLVGRARAVRVDADMIRRDRSAQGISYVFLAANLQRFTIDHDDVMIKAAIHAYLGQYLPRLGRHFVAVSTLLDRIRYAGGLTAVQAASEAEARQLTVDDPWGRIFPGRLYQTSSSFFRRQPSPVGPGTQRSGGGSPWPFHWDVSP